MKVLNFFIGLFVFFSFIMLVSASCTDTDGGEDYYVKGLLDIGYFQGEDYCTVYDTTVMEYSCLEDGTFGEERFLCPSGVCEDGACVEENEVDVNLECKDSDDGKDYYIMGAVSVGESIYEDYCADENRLMEYSCLENGELEDSGYLCPDGCSEGACLGLEEVNDERFCRDSDGGEDYYVKGKVVTDYTSIEDYCMGPGSLNEQFCEGDTLGQKNYICPSSVCKDGACSKEDENIMSVDPSENEVLEVPLGDEYFCNGCDLDEKCYSFGYRKSGKFCLDDGNFVSQKASEGSCENNFECTSNVCVSGSCVDEGLIQKIFSWFRRLFGGS